MQEEIEQKSAALMINGTKFSLRTLKTAAIKLLAHRQNPSTSGVKHRGKQTVRQLVGQNQGVLHDWLIRHQAGAGVAHGGRHKSFRKAAAPGRWLCLRFCFVAAEFPSCRSARRSACWTAAPACRVSQKQVGREEVPQRGREYGSARRGTRKRHRAVYRPCFQKQHPADADGTADHKQPPQRPQDGAGTKTSWSSAVQGSGKTRFL